VCVGKQGERRALEGGSEGRLLRGVCECRGRSGGSVVLASLNGTSDGPVGLSAARASLEGGLALRAAERERERREGRSPRRRLCAHVSTCKQRRGPQVVSVGDVRALC